jgi:hypothetical protein
MTNRYDPFFRRVLDVRLFLRWLLVNFDALGATAVLVTTLFALSGFASAGIAGLCITSGQGYSLLSGFSWLISLSNVIYDLDLLGLQVRMPLEFSVLWIRTFNTHLDSGQRWSLI